jgi:hypothetical protein
VGKDFAAPDTQSMLCEATRLPQVWRVAIFFPRATGTTHFGGIDLPQHEIFPIKKIL